MKKLALLLAAVAVFFSCRVRLDESSVKAEQENKELQSVVGEVLRKVIVLYPNQAARGYLHKSDLIIKHFCGLTLAGYVSLDTLDIVLSRLGQGSVYDIRGEFHKNFEKALSLYNDAHRECSVGDSERVKILKLVEEARAILIPLAKQIQGVKIDEKDLLKASEVTLPE